MTTQRGEEPAAVLPAGDDWFTQPQPRVSADGLPVGPTVEALRAVVNGAGTPWTPPGPAGPPGGGPRNGHGPDGGPRDGYGADGGARDGDGPDGGPRNGHGPDGGRLLGAGSDGVRGPDGASEGSQDGDAGDGRPGAHRMAGEDAAPARAGRTGRRRRAGRGGDGGGVAREDGFDPGDTGTWRVRDVVPGADGGRRHTTILRYLLGLLAADRLRALTRWAWAVPVAGLFLLLVRPRWIGAAVVVLGVLLVVGRALAGRLIARRSLARRYRPVEDDLRAAVEAGKANLRGELERVGLPTGRWSMPLSVLRLARGSDRSAARSKLREVEIHRILPEAQLQRALKVLDEAAPTTR